MNELAESSGVVEVVLPADAPAGAKRRGWGSGRATVEVTAPDHFSARLFVELVGSLFPFELVATGTAWVIRLQPPSESAWQKDVVVLMQRWLEACPLPCATIAWDGRRYVFRSALTHSEPETGFDPSPPIRPKRTARIVKSRSSILRAGATSGDALFAQAQLAPEMKP